MAGTPGMIGKGLKYAVKYGPQIAVVVKVAKEPAQEAAKKAWATQHARSSAFAQAKTLADGSVLKVFHEGTPVWVVFSGDDVITWVPRPDGASIESLLDHADLSQRVRPADRPTAAKRVKKFAPRRRKGSVDESSDPLWQTAPQDAVPQDAVPQDSMPHDAQAGRARWSDRP